MAVRFVPRRGAERELASSPGIGHVVKQNVDAVTAEAKSIAQRDAYLSGDFHDGIQGGTELTDEGHVGRVAGTHWSSHFIEFGTSDTLAKAVLRRAGEALGLDFTIRR